MKNAGECGAIDEILVVDTLIRDPEIVGLMDQAERSDGTVVVFSTGFEPGKQLDALGGVAALLRYRIG